MSIHETRPYSIDFLKAAEQAAMGKVMDIHLDQAMKHSFFQFTPLMIDRANEETDNQRVDRLEGALRYGLVAENFAKRIGIQFSRNWHDRANEKYVSLGDYNQSLNNAFYYCTFSSTQTQIPRENIYMILIKKRFPHATPRGEISGEAWAQNRIALRFFMGIVIIDGTGEDASEALRERIDITSSSTRDTANMVLEKMRSIYKNKPSLFFPIYGLSGSLYWPKQMTYQEVQSFVSSRKS